MDEKPPKSRKSHLDWPALIIGFVVAIVPGWLATWAIVNALARSTWLLDIGFLLVDFVVWLPLSREARVSAIRFLSYAVVRLPGLLFFVLVWWAVYKVIGRLAHRSEGRW